MKHSFNIFLSVFILFLSAARAQRVEIEIPDIKLDRAYIYSISGENLILRDSVSAAGNGVFAFSAPPGKLHAGFHRLSFDKKRSLDFIVDGEDIKITAHPGHLPDSLKVISSESNKLYYSFLRLNKEYKSKSELLQFFLARYPKDDELYSVTSRRLLRLQEDYLRFANITAQIRPSSFIARYIRSAQLPVVDAGQPPEKHLAYLKAHALDKVDFHDAELIKSDLFSGKSIEYLTYYRNPQLPKELLEKEFMTAVDTVLGRAKVNTDVYEHVVEYLLDGFKKFGFDVVIDYILDNYVIKDELCIDEKLETALQRRIDQAKLFKIGSQVPDIISSDSSGKQIGLYGIRSEQVLILFYATWCPHCQSILPRINELYERQKEKRTEVLAVSMDTSRADWLRYLGASGTEWLNVSDLKGWRGKAVTDYYIYATPTMFLVDRERKIAAKPLTVEDLTKWF